MKTIVSLLCILLTASINPLRAGSDTFVDYQNYNHGYCPKCNCYPCQCALSGGDVNPNVPPGPGPVPGAPPPGPGPNAAAAATPPVPPNPAAPCNTPKAPTAAVNCGINLCLLGIGIAAVATIAAIVISANNDADPAS